jgi:RNA polymerase sigma-70 factor (ECF subfamily)
VEQEDLQLIREARKGSREAFTLLVRNYKDFVYRTAYGIVQNHMDAEDIVQESFVKAFRSFRQLKDDFAFPSWISTITTRISFDFLKKRKSNIVPYESEAYSIQAKDTGTEQTALRLSITQALSRLSDEHRTIIVLREVQGFDYQEIADILGIPIGTVRSRLHAARMQMRKLLSEKEDGDVL